jgi:hypothetical protein
MSKNKKPAKKYKPRDCINPMSAFAPAPKSEQMRIMVYFWSALESVQRGANPSSEDWQALSDAINTVETLARTEKLPKSETMVFVNKAVEAMVHAANRHKAGGAMRFDGAGLQAVRDVVSIYEQAMSQLSALTMGRAQMQTQEAINKLIKNKSATVVEI